MKFENRGQVEYVGRTNAAVEDKGEYWFSRVLGKYWVAINKDDNGLSPHIRDGFWEPWIMLWVSQNVEEGFKCADLGANVGFYTYQLAASGASVDAFEPNPAVFKLLTEAHDKNMEEHDNWSVKLINKAVSSTAGEFSFIVPRNHPMNGSLHKSVYSPNGEDEITVKAVGKLGRYDFIKIDIEGGEIDVFDLLDPEKHPLVLMEFRWDRYETPIDFAEAIFEKYSNVTFVKFDGKEERLDRASQLEAREHEDWMLVLRP